MSRDTKDLALLVFPTYPSIINDVKISTIKKLKENNIIIYKIIQEKYFFSMYLNQPIKASNIISSFVGIKKIEIAISSPNNIKSIINNIIKIGQKIIVEEKFFIRVFSENANFLPRDIEFIATGLLVEKLANRRSRPSTNEESASKIMRVYIGNVKSYISWKSLNGIGGNSYGKLKKKAFIIIYNQISLLSLKKIIHM
jgi:adenylyl- and sulfurtransferase ThiI